jgi:hypothetical protein
MSTDRTESPAPAGAPDHQAIDTDIPARLDRLPWSRFHWLLVSALGLTWVLDGLEATMVGAVDPRLMNEGTLGLRADQIGLVHTVYLAGAILGLVLVASQAFFYNGVSTSYPLVIHQYHGVPEDRTGLDVLAMAGANLLGPLLLGPLFDSVGRRVMISNTSALAGAVIVGSEILFLHGELPPSSQTALWAAAFFFASAAASAGYLTVSEVFPLEMRALAIALFIALATAVGGLGPR